VKKLDFKWEPFEQQNLIEKERSRIARDMHDDLGARLSEIVLHGNQAAGENLSSEQIRELAGKMTGAARELVDSLDAIVWAVNPKNDSLDKFADYVCEYLQSYLETASIRYSVNVPQQMPEYQLSSEARHNLYLVIKEALHNIVKHARATHVDFRMQVLDSTLTASIADDGQGFSRKGSSDFGNGLESMAARIKNIGGRFELATSRGKGTRIHFQVPLTGNADAA